MGRGGGGGGGSARGRGRGGGAHQVAAADVEAGQVVDGILRVVDVLVHHKRGPARVGRVAEPNLPDRAELAEDVVHLLRGDLEGEVPHV